MKKTIITIALACVSLPVFSDDGSEFIKRPRCDAEVVVEHMGMRQSKWLETIDILEAQGTLGHNWAEEYRKLIKEAYQLQTDEEIAEWVKEKCKDFRK